MLKNINKRNLQTKKILGPLNIQKVIFHNTTTEYIVSDFMHRQTDKEQKISLKKQH